MYKPGDFMEPIKFPPATCSDTPLINDVDMLERTPDPMTNISRGVFALKWFISLSMLTTLS
jgi:hypothetical protein